MLELTIAVLGSAITVAGSLWRVFNVIADLRSKINEVNHRIDLLEVGTNGVRERMEHINTRLAKSHQSLGETVVQMDGWLNKHTEYVSRRNP